MYICFVFFLFCFFVVVVVVFFFFPYQIGVTVICPNSYATNVFSYVIQGLKEERIIAIV